MSQIRKYEKAAVLILALILAAQAGVSFLVKTRRIHGYLTAHLESSFGRPVQVGQFSMRILPIPELDAEGVTISEDPVFGREYFLRAERMTASFRWMGLLRGHFEFGTMSLTRPSLILVRTAEGRWNLEGWLPPARSGGAATAGPQLPAAPTHRLQKIEFDDGRINFKQGDEKKPFAFTNVSGNVEQIAPGRWELRLEAQPWRSGALLQSTGTLYVRGDVAGTSARLKPAEIQLHWEQVSLADLFRLVTGNDPGVRGTFALDGKASVGAPNPGAEDGSSDWRIELQARTTKVHRWDLTERDDNPRLNVNLKGFWDPAAGEARAEELIIEGPRSNMRGTGVLKTESPAEWTVKLGSVAVQGQDVLAWYRAFQLGVAEEAGVEGLVAGSATLSGWPLRWEEGALRCDGATIRIPGLNAPGRVEPSHGSVRGGKFVVENVRMLLAANGEGQEKGNNGEKPAGKARPAENSEDTIEASVMEYSSLEKGELRLNLRLADVARAFKLAAAFGHPLNRGWEYTGSAAGVAGWSWSRATEEVHTSGSLELTRGQLEVAGLNQPLKLEQTRLSWRDGQRGVAIANAEGFGATWTGAIEEGPSSNVAGEKHWQFQLHADHLDAAELDRWFGPRGRPNWLQRLLASFAGGQNLGAQASELLRQVFAEGALTADTVTIEKVKLAKARAKVVVHDLHLQVEDAKAEWASGNVRAGMRGAFLPVPKYEVSAEFEHIDLAQLPWLAKGADRWSGVASGDVQLATEGVGREELLNRLAGRGELQLKALEFQGWDVEASEQTGAIHKGISRWEGGQGKFSIKDRAIKFDVLELDAMHSKTILLGSIDFGLESNLVFRSQSGDKRSGKATAPPRLVQVSGPLATPLVIVEPVTVPAAKR